MSAVGLNATTIAISVISLIFYTVGCIGYSDSRNTIEKVSWIRTKEDDTKIWFGLHRAYVTVGGNNAFVVDYGGDECSFCNKCEQDGKSALGLTIISLIGTTFAIVFCSYLLVCHNTGMQIANVFFCLLAAATSLIGIGLFMNDCYNKIDDSIDSDLHYGPGSILTTLAMLLMFVATILQIAAAATAGKEAPTRKPMYASPPAAPAANAE